MRFVLVFLALSSVASGQGIEAWKLTNGKAFRAEILEVDATTDTVTFLIPQRVPLENLDSVSQDRIREHIKKNQGIKNGDFPGLWTPIPNCTIGQWRDASPRERRQHVAYENIGFVIQPNVRRFEMLQVSSEIYETLLELIIEEKVSDDALVSDVMRSIVNARADHIKKQKQAFEDQRARDTQFDVLESVIK
ncbi:hypothetical protein Mal15_21850 [Stieleria maiorica]|uniref:Uncharacterized protein n=1 Tax=Stieleria maiorica TaxID=2795974 RepID=A0A5B9MGB0_9BACT|nr:hypothetical protein [Stieleria maiorica]QEF98137.1 hypothetical protein Mal15_21850 [Stieleria maiorica]